MKEKFRVKKHQEFQDIINSIMEEDEDILLEHSTLKSENN